MFNSILSKLYKNVTFDTSSYVATRKTAKCYKILKQNDLSIKLDKHDINKAEQFLKELNIKLKKLVILHVRDNSFKLLMARLIDHLILKTLVYQLIIY